MSTKLYAEASAYCLILQKSSEGNKAEPRPGNSVFDTEKYLESLGVTKPTTALPDAECSTATGVGSDMPSHDWAQPAQASGA